MKISFDVKKQVESFQKQLNSLIKKKPKTGPFQKGDIVTAFGNTGEVKSISENGFVIVKFPEFESTVVFNLDGKLMSWNKDAILKKV
jgi:hypothetical protein